MRFLLATAAALFLSGTLLSCSPAPEVEKTTPADEATAEERAAIDRTLVQLTGLFRKNGYEGSFDKMPILVVSNDPGQPGWAGRCVGIGKGTGRYIAISRWAFQHNSEDESDSRLTAVLLHEIGHCYFAREHDHELVSSSTYETNVEYSGRRGRRQNRVDGVPATVMYVTRGHFPHASIVTANREFLTYYVRELLGFPKIQNINDLSKFKSVKIRKKLETAENDSVR
ncbi:MAG: hypothetical protein EOP09_16755 [Proteobacteria bacterium]|nr:MAG: hypothetical protein EOP09_16755 [Pseudomonadota bacterium]